MFNISMQYKKVALNVRTSKTVKSMFTNVNS